MNDIRLNLLRMRNFMPFGNNFQEVDLSRIGSTLILGKNLDVPNIDGAANGVGKTSILNAITFAFFNKPFDNISLQRLVNNINNYTDTVMETSLSFYKGEDLYEIYRSRGKVNVIKLTCNGEDITLDSILANDKYIEEIIGMSYELFTNIVVFSTNSIPFIQQPIAYQRAIFEELFSITRLSEKAVKIKESVSTTKVDISVLQGKIQEQESFLKVYEKQLDDATKRFDKWEKEKENSLKSLKEEYEIFKDIDYDLETKLHEECEILLKDINTITLENNNLSSTLVNQKNDKSTFSKELNHLKNDKCPYCNQSFEASRQKITSLEYKVKSLDESILELSKTIKNNNKKLNDLSSKYNTIFEQRIFHSISEIVEGKHKVDSTTEKIKAVENSVNPHTDNLESLLSSKFIEINYDELNNKKKRLEHLEFMAKLLTDKNSFIRKSIINNTIPLLNNQITFYTKQLNLPHLIHFKPDMNCVVSQYGIELDYGNLSGGEKKRVNLALSLAFRDVFQHTKCRFNFIFFDEIDNSLDTLGINDMFKMFKTKCWDDNLSLFLISHRPEAIGRFDKTMMITKQNGFSEITM